MKNKRLLVLLQIFVITFLPIFLVYIPFLLKLDKFIFLNIREPGFANILKNWDGPHYIIIAKTLYNLDQVGKLLFIPIDVRYYPAHFPLYPLFIILFSAVFNRLYSGLIVNLLFGFFLNILFFKVVSRYTKHPLFLTFLFTIFPPRFWVVRSIIAPETMMLFFILLSFYLWEKKKYFLSSLVGFFSVLTKIQAIFLFFGYLGEIIEEKIKNKIKIKIQLFKLWIILIPLAFVILSIFYYFRVGDFLAFFHAEKGNNLFVYFPFSQFNYSNPWSGAWLEDIVFYFIAMFVLVVSLYKRKERNWFYFSLSYVLFLIVIPQRDITRFSYPLLPFFLITFEQFFTSKIFKAAFFFSLPALYFFTVNFILINQAPIADWSLLLK